MGLACGPLPFVLGDKRKQKRRRGSPGPQGILSVLFLGEPPHRYHKNQRYNKGLRPRVLGRRMFSVPRPTGPGGPLGSLLVWADSGNMVIVDFHQEKIDKVTRGFRGFPPDASFHLPYLNHLGQTRGHLRGPGQTSHVCTHAQTGPLKGGAKAQAVLYGMSVYKREPIRCRLRIGSYSA